MKTVNYCLIILISLILTSCATSRVSRQVSKQLPDSKIAIAYIQLEKQINYMEALYRVLWTENRTKKVSFEGLWDIEKDMSDLVSQKMKDLALNATPLYQIASKSEIQEYAVEIKKYRKSLEELEEKPYVVNESLLKALKKRGYNFLITLHSDYIYVNANTGSTLGSARTSMSLYNISENKIIFNKVFLILGNFKFKDGFYEKSIREIEDNNMYKLKEGLRRWATKSIYKDLPKHLGIPSKMSDESNNAAIADPDEKKQDSVFTPSHLQR